MTIMLTGGAGYIGSHTCVELLEAGYPVVVVDNLSNSKMASIERVQRITGKSVNFHQVDLQDKSALSAVFDAYDIQAVIHFAGFKAVGESVAFPLRYYQNNIVATLTLCDVMAAHNVKNMVFSSSATVYGDPSHTPVTEDLPIHPTNPYGRTKSMIEEMLGDIYLADTDWNIARLRYFNPVGAHPSGLIGEDPNDIPNNLLPYITQVGVGKLSELRVFGNDYPTPDGTGVRDFIHVVDLAAGHIHALNKLASEPGMVTYNLGTGRGYSVLELIAAFESVTGRHIPYRIVARRPGDVASSFADPSRANREMGWTATRFLEDICRDAWNWQSRNPNGYA